MKIMSVKDRGGKILFILKADIKFYIYAEGEACN